MAEVRMNARYAGNCRICGQRFSAGTDIFYEKGRGARHAGCEEVVLPPDAIAISRESDAYHQGEVVKARVNREWKYCTVLTCSQQYFSEDGMSFGLSDDSGYLYSAKCREATEEESRPLREREAFRQELVNKRYALRQIADRIISSPKPQVYPGWSSPLKCFLQNP